MRRLERVAVGVALGLLAAVGGCTEDAGAGGGATPEAPTATSTQPPEKGGPLTDLPECTAPPDAVEAEAAGDLVLPEGTVVTGVDDLGELVSVRGYVALTPIQVRLFYAEAPGLQLYVVEDEVYEAEILFGSGDNRVFVKAQAQCRQGSVLSMFVGPEDGEGLPPVSAR
jgi:hypothetical protein